MNKLCLERIKILKSILTNDHATVEDIIEVVDWKYQMKLNDSSVEENNIRLQKLQLKKTYHFSKYEQQQTIRVVIIIESYNHSIFCVYVIFTGQRF